MVDRDMQGIVFDNGSAEFKCGFSGDDAPKAVFPTVVGKPKNHSKEEKISTKNYFIGDEAKAKRGVLELSCPFENGVITNWDEMEKIWHHAFYNELKVTPEEHPVLLTDSTINDKNSKEKMISIMLETFNVPGVYVENQSILTLLNFGKGSGLIVGSGHSISFTSVIFEGNELLHTTQKHNHAGCLITDYLVKLFCEKGYEMTSLAEREIVNDIKEKLGYIAFDYENELENTKTSKFCEREYKLPDESKITVGSERFKAPEILFKPSLLGLKIPGIQKMTFDSIQKCDPDLKNFFYNNICLAGGSTMFEGIAERMCDEVQKCAPPSTRIRVNAPPERKYSAWIGGSILSSLTVFEERWITKKELDEKGANRVVQK